MKLKEIHRTSTFAWSPYSALPLLATGTVAGALDESFSNESQLEIWAPDFLDRDEFDLGREGQHGPKSFVTDTARFNRLAWGYVDSTRPQGVIAAGLENGDLALWDADKILGRADASESLIFRNSLHTGPVRGLDFNPIQTNLLASGSVGSEVYIWDLKDPSKPYTPTPGTRSTKLDEITSIAWNQQVQYVLAGASSTGYTVVWDLRGKREVVALAYGGGAGTLQGQVGTGSGMAVGGRRGMSDIAWHPENATRLVTASEDDTSPVIMVWDLRNARAPEKILTGHEKGVLSLSWCKQDPDLLLSCGKDNRALCWNPQTSEIIGELPSADNWAFQVDWCPRNPDVLATAFFDGRVEIHSLQSTNKTSTDDAKATAQQTNGADIFDVQGFSRASQGGTLSLKQPPRWLSRPVSTCFGFGGKLVTVSNLPSAQGKNQSSIVHIRKVVTEQDLVERAIALQTAIEGESLKTFAEERIASSSSDSWRALLSLFNADSRDELVTLLGFSKSEIASKVAEAMESLKSSAADSKSISDDDISEKVHEPVVSFAEPERQEPSENSDGAEKTPSEVSASAASDTTSAARLEGDGESTTTVPSLFGDDDGPGTPQFDAGRDFFNTVNATQDDGELHAVHIPHMNYGIDSSVAATVGSGPSSVTSENSKNGSFRIYPADEPDTDRLVTKALVLGDFESAVSLCLSTDRFADAILLATKGGPELLQRTQKAYFERYASSSPYLRLFQSIVTNDLADIVENADLREWQEIFVVLCTFANQDDFHGLAEQLGRRLESKFSITKSSSDSDIKGTASLFRKNATLTYLAAAKLERLVNIWIEELLEEEANISADENTQSGSQYAAHAHALQTFIEKVTVFRSATNYVDDELSSTSEETTKAFKLSALYDRYFEYADILSTQGLLKEAMMFLKLMPVGYKGSGGVDLHIGRDRLSTAVEAPVASISTARPALPAATTTAKAPYDYSHYGAPSQPTVPSQPSTYNTAYTSSVTYAPSTNNVQQPVYPATQPGYQPPYNPSASLTQPPHLRQQPAPPVHIPPPPRAANGTPGNNPTPAPPPKRQDNGGWNDAPVMGPNRGSGPSHPSKPAAITAPFANAPSSNSPQGSPYAGQGQGPMAPTPPSRPGSVQARPPPPPQRMQGPPPSGSFGNQPRPPSRTAGPPQPMPPPGRHMSPAQQQAPPRQPTPGQYAPPPSSRGPIPGQTPPPSQFAHPPPGQPHAQLQRQAPGPYPPPSQPQNLAYNVGPSAQMPPPQQVQPGPYGPPQGHQRPGPPQPPQAGGLPPPPPPGGSGGPPPRTASSAAAGRSAPPPPKYPVGDRSHIPDSSRPAYNVISEQLNHMKQTTPPQQKRLVDDLERRINPLFDALNCETLTKPTVDQLLVLTRAMQAHDRPAALAIHIDLLTRGSQTDDIALWMSGIKQLIMRL